MCPYNVCLENRHEHMASHPSSAAENRKWLNNPQRKSLNLRSSSFKVSLIKYIFQQRWLRMQLASLKRGDTVIKMGVRQLEMRKSYFTCCRAVTIWRQTTLTRRGKRTASRLGDRHPLCQNRHYRREELRKTGWLVRETGKHSKTVGKPGPHLVGKASLSAPQE